MWKKDAIALEKLRVNSERIVDSGELIVESY
jgi:hypothetical protein